MVALATMATIIASQAVILGAFLGGPPGHPARLPAAAADKAHVGGRPGQIYVPFVNWLLMAAVLSLVVGFQSSAAASRLPTGWR